MDQISKNTNLSLTRSIYSLNTNSCFEIKSSRKLPICHLCDRATVPESSRYSIRRSVECFVLGRDGRMDYNIPAETFGLTCMKCESIKDELTLDLVDSIAKLSPSHVNSLYILPKVECGCNSC